MSVEKQMLQKARDQAILLNAVLEETLAIKRRIETDGEDRDKIE